MRCFSWSSLGSIHLLGNVMLLYQIAFLVYWPFWTETTGFPVNPKIFRFNISDTFRKKIKYFPKSLTTCQIMLKTKTKLHKTRLQNISSLIISTKHVQLFAASIPLNIKCNNKYSFANDIVFIWRGNNLEKNKFVYWQQETDEV